MLKKSFAFILFMTTVMLFSSHTTREEQFIIQLEIKPVEYSNTTYLVNPLLEFPVDETTYNHLNEGSQIYPGRHYGSLYLQGHDKNVKIYVRHKHKHYK